MLNYAKVTPGSPIIKKTTKRTNTYEVLKKEIDGTLGCYQLGQLDIWHDDEFLFVHNSDPTMIIKNNPSSHIENDDICLCGPLVLASHNEEGDTVSLTPYADLMTTRFISAELGDKKILVYRNYIHKD